MGTCRVVYRAPGNIQNMHKDPMHNVYNNPLAVKTRTFWDVSLCYRKRAEGSDKLTVGQAIDRLQHIAEGTGEQRLLHRRVSYLLHYIVLGDELSDEEKGVDKA